MSAQNRTALPDPVPRLLYDRKEAARQLSISVRSLDYLLAAKNFKTRKIGERPKWEQLRKAKEQ